MNKRQTEIKKRPRDKAVAISPTFDIPWDKVRARLESAASTLEARNILAQEGIDKKRQYLEDLARQYRILVRKSERKDRLITHIINRVVGSRIYAETMRGIDLRMHKE